MRSAATLPEKDLRSDWTLPERTRLGSYRIIEVLGRGGMGTVYKAQHVRLDRQVALKALHQPFTHQEEAVNRFLAEAWATNNIDNDHIVEVSHVSEVSRGETPYLVMELLEGELLLDLMRREDSLPLDRCLDIAIQITDALDAAHEAGFVHRDLKPGNVFLADKGDHHDFVKLLDFGVAKLMEQSRAARDSTFDLRETMPGVVVGTPVYMAPEQAAGRTIDRRSDIYAFGVILYEMITGEPPFTDQSVSELLRKHQSVMPSVDEDISQERPRVPEPLVALIRSCLQKKPDKRPDDMAVVGEQLRRIRGERRSMSEPSESTEWRNASSGASIPTARWLVPTAIAVLSLFLGGVLSSSLEGQEGTTVLEAAITDVNDAEEAVHVHIKSSPTGAEVVRPGEPEALGRTPLELSLPPSEQTATFELHLEGYRPIDHEISLTKDVQLVVALQPLPTLAEPAALERDLSSLDVESCAPEVRAEPSRARAAARAGPPFLASTSSPTRPRATPSAPPPRTRETVQLNRPHRPLTPNLAHPVGQPRPADGAGYRSGGEASRGRPAGGGGRRRGSRATR